MKLCCSALVGPGVHIKAVADLLGHNSIKRAYRAPSDIAHVAVISRARERPDLLADVSQFDTSNRVVYAIVGDAFVLHNRDGFWALRYIDKLDSRARTLHREDLVDFRYAIQPNRTPDFSGFVFLRRTPAHRAAAAPAAAHRLVGTLRPTGTPDRLGGHSPETGHASG